MLNPLFKAISKTNQNINQGNSEENSYVPSELAGAAWQSQAFLLWVYKKKKIGQSQSLELTKSSANVSESNVVISERNSLAFSFPRFDARTRNWASNAASRARETVTEEKDCVLAIHSCQKPNLAYRGSSAWSFVNHSLAMTSNTITYIILPFPLEKGKGEDAWTCKHREPTCHLVTMKNAFHSTFEVFFPSKWNKPIYSYIFWVLLLSYIVKIKHEAFLSTNKHYCN